MALFGSITAKWLVTKQKLVKRPTKNTEPTPAVVVNTSFISHADNSFYELGISLDACVGEALVKGYFPREQMLCTKTIYNYIDKGLMRIRNHNLLEKVSIKPKLNRVCENKKILGRSIEERPDIDNKLKFGHWELPYL